MTHLTNTALTGNYQICQRCVMDTSDPHIRFYEDGTCDRCRDYEIQYKKAPFITDPKQEGLKRVIEKIKKAGRGLDYDCIMGLSGGVDSSYVALLAHRFGLRPLAIHLDNGWNSEISVSNIEKIVKNFKLDLITHVINWEEFKDLQRSFLKASVIDIEMLSDHAITAVIYNHAIKHKIKYILSGANIVTESMMPDTWTHRKSDFRNIKKIQQKFGRLKIPTFPHMGTLKRLFYDLSGKASFFRILNYVPYNREGAIRELEEAIGWKYYGGKHYESLFTQFYQSYILPNKFKVDKRRPHLSCLIMSGQLTREKALQILAEPAFSPTGASITVDVEYILKKLNLSAEEFKNIMNAPPKSHLDYPSDEWVIKYLKTARKLFLKYTQ